MPRPKQILALCGSTRQGSLNQSILQIAIASAEAAGAKVTTITLKDFPLPLYNADLESEMGLPRPAVNLKTLFLAHSALLIATPEYNGGMTPLLKNTIDWISRPHEKELPLACFDGMVAGLVSASPGSLGGLRSIHQLRSVLSDIRVLVLPRVVAVPQADKLLLPNGRLSDEKLNDQLTKLGTEIWAMTNQLAK